MTNLSNASLVFLTMCALLHVSCQSQTGTRTERHSVNHVDIRKPVFQPDVYHGKRVMVTGTLSANEEMALLYFSPEDWKYGVTWNSVSLYPSSNAGGGLGTMLASSRSVNGKQVVIVGVYEAAGRPRLHQPGAIICDRIMTAGPDGQVVYDESRMQDGVQGPQTRE